MSDFTYRLTSVPEAFTEDDIRQLFPEDAGKVAVVSRAPCISADKGIQVATVTFYSVPSFDKPLAQTGGDCLLHALIQGSRRPEVGPEIRIDNNFFGLTPLNNSNPNEIVADVVAITGLGGRGFSSWANPEGKMWLRDFLPSDVANIRVMIYGYPSKLEKSSSRARLIDYTIQFLQIFESARRSPKERVRPIIFIGHSLGCLIIKQLLGEVAGKIRPDLDLLQSAYAIVFFGAPHRGLYTEALQTVTQGKPTEEMIKDLSPNSWLLVSLNDMFRAFADSVQLISCYEMNETPTVEETSEGTLKRTGAPRLIVNPNSACLFWKDELIIPVHANHSTMAKLMGSAGSAYFTIKDKLQQVVESIRSGLGGSLLADSPFGFAQFATISSLQTACIKAYRLLTVPEMVRQDALLLIERTRFEVWQTEFFGKRQLRSTSNSAHLDLALKILESKALIIGNFFCLKEQYGFRFQFMGDSPDAGPIKMAERPLDEIHEALDGAKNLKPMVSDVLKYRKLVSRMQNLNDMLILLLPGWDTTTFNQAVTTSLIAAKDIPTLRSLERTAKGSESLVAVGQAASTKLWTLEIRRMSKGISTIKEHLDLPKSSIRFLGGANELYKSRTPALYTSPDGIILHVLVEWKYPDPAKDDFDGTMQNRDVESIVGWLHKSHRPEGLKVLTCLGYFEDTDRFGIVYEKPSSADQRHDPVSLSELLSDEGDDHMPDLGDRFRLAYALASVINEIHSTGWLHKNINSENILFFGNSSSSPESVANISSPFVAGFDFSRHTMSPSTPPTISRTYELYCHPSYLSEKGFASDYRWKYDIYSLGLVLLEIGHWRTLESLIDHDAPREELRDQVKTECIPGLAESMGSVYRDAVSACITGAYWPLDDDHQTLEELNEFRTRVLGELGRCFA